MPSNSKFWSTIPFVPRVRWWIPLALGAYLIPTVLGFIGMVTGASSFVPDPFWHAPLLIALGR